MTNRLLQRSLRPDPRAARGGFTLLEVLLAIFIFSLIMMSLFMLLNQSSRTYEKVVTRVDAMFQGRGAVDVISRDFRSVFFMNESDYNVTARREQERLINQARTIQIEELRGDRPRDEDREDRRRRRDEEDEDFLLPPEIDLSFVGKDAGDQDVVSFVTYQPNRPMGYYAPWGLRRIHYYLDGYTLMRTEETVFKEEIAPDGTIVSRPTPEPEKIAQGVVAFDLKYGFWYDGEWRIADAWHSSGQEYRFPKPSLSYEEMELDFRAAQAFFAAIPKDDLPAFVRIEMGFQSPRGGQVTWFRKTFRLFQSQETYFPLENLLPYGDQRRSELTDRRRR